jgi:serine/threonine-protein kinase
MSSCPPPESLQRLLAGNLDAAEADTIAGHVAACAHCEAVLEQLSDYPELRGWLSADDSADAVTTPDLARLNRPLACASDLNGPPERQRSATGLPFLGPPRCEGDLGSLGPYCVEAELGRGGMGVVLKARDNTLRRSVALKVLRPDMAGEGGRARLVREARLAAQLQHDHVVPVHAVLELPGGLPCVVMEYVAGPSLAQRVRTPPPLPPREAARLLAGVADALHTAHAAGLVHRDVKPGNILLDAQTGRARLGDFGVAREVIGATALTGEGALVGTPAYMSPEQARGEPATAGSDVYGLGTTLYEALTGQAPFGGAAHMVLRRVLEEEPIPPRRLQDAVPPDLETICLRAMAKEPGRRYPSAREFGDDLRRFLAGEPIRARPAGPVERGWRWCRRNPRVAALGSVVGALLLLLVGGSVVATLWISAARNQADRDRIAAEQSAAAARHAETEARANADAASAYFAHAIEAFQALYDGADNRLRGRPDADDLRRELLQTAVKGVEGVARRNAEKPATGRGMVLAHLRLGNLFFRLGRPEEARKQFERARDLALQLPGAEAKTPQALGDLAVAWQNLGNLDLFAGRSKDAIAPYREALRCREQAARMDSGNARVRRDLASAHSRLANAYATAGEPASARRHYEQALALETPAGKGPPRDLYDRHIRLGECCETLGEFEAAANHFRQALACAAAFPGAERPDSANRWLMMWAHVTLARVVSWLGDAKKAEEHLRQAVVMAGPVAARHTDHVDVQHMTALAWADLASVQLKRDDPVSARDSARKALAIGERLARLYPADVRWLRAVRKFTFLLARVEEREERYQQAVEWTRRALDFSRRAPLHSSDPDLKQIRQDVELDLALYCTASEPGVDDLAFVLSRPQKLSVALLIVRGSRLARRGRHAEAAVTTAHLRRLSPDNVYHLVGAARIYGLCVAAVDREPTSDAARREGYVKEALDCLRASVRRDRLYVLGMRSHSDLAALRDRPDFRALLQSSPARPTTPAQQAK